MNNTIRQIVRFFAGKKNPYRFFGRFSIIYILFISLVFTYKYDFYSPDFREIPFMQMVVLALLSGVIFVFIIKEYDRRKEKGELLSFRKWNSQKETSKDQTQTNK